MIINVGASAGTVGFCEKEFWSSDGCFCIEKNVFYNDKFLYYLLKSKEEEFCAKVRKAGIPTLDSKVIEKTIIPKPPIEVQNEIVRILDDFTELTSDLTSELTSELAARKQQYEFYKDSMFKFDSKISTKKIGELCDIVTKQTGFDYTKHIKGSLETTKKENTLPYIQTKFFTGTKFNYNTDYYIPEKMANKFPNILLDKKCMLLSIVGASIGNIGLFPGNVKCFLGGAICVAKISEQNNKEYIYYYMTSKYGQKQIFKKIKGAGQATVTIDDIRKFDIPMPDRQIQEKIVCKLNELDSRYNGISQVISNEINERQIQYEYYRNKLLNFKELKVEN